MKNKHYLKLSKQRQMTNIKFENTILPSLQFRRANGPTYSFVNDVFGVTFIEVEKWHTELNESIGYFRELCGEGFDVVNADDYTSYYFAFANAEDVLILKLKYPTLLYGVKNDLFL